MQAGLNFSFVLSRDFQPGKMTIVNIKWKVLQFFRKSNLQMSLYDSNHWTRYTLLLHHCLKCSKISSLFFFLITATVVEASSMYSFISILLLCSSKCVPCLSEQNIKVFHQLLYSACIINPTVPTHMVCFLLALLCFVLKTLGCCFLNYFLISVNHWPHLQSE